MPIVRPTHYTDEEFHKLPTKINDPPIIFMGLRGRELTVIGGECARLVILWFFVSGSALALIGVTIVLVPTILFTGLMFWISHSKMPKTYTHHLRFVIKTWNEPPQWTGDAFESTWGASREDLGKTMKNKSKNKGKGK